MYAKTLCLLVALGLTSCSALLDFAECSADADCAALGAGLTCSAQGYCVEEGGAPQGLACETHRDCAAQGETWLCGAKGVCLDALNERCNRFIGPTGRENAVVLGSVLPTLEFGTSGLPREDAIALAVEEINDGGGLPGGRALVVIGCDDSGNRDLGIAASTFLVEEIGVPAIIGPAFSGVTIDVTTQVTIPAGVMSISPSATNPGIASLDDDGLVWRTAANDVFQSVAIADQLRLLGATSVVAFGKDDPYGKGLLNRVNEELAADLGEEGFFGALYPDPGKVERPDYASLVVDALAFARKPQVVMIFGTSEAANIIDVFETAVEERGLPAPLYLLSDGGKNAEALGALLEARPALRERITGTEPYHVNGAIYESFALRFQQKYRAQPGTFTANAYDATWLLAYAISALEPNGALTGGVIAGAMRRLVEGREVEAGPSQFPEARTLLSTGSPINFTGASGALDFDLELGEAPANVARWEIEARPDGLRFPIQQLYLVGAEGRGQWVEF
jgi:ABC-type branched-subunit amino acid transport system substrate-binding protein